MESDLLIYFKCTACSECFMSEEVFFAHTRTWHCKILISEGHQPGNEENVKHDVTSLNLEDVKQEDSNCWQEPIEMCNSEPTFVDKNHSQDRTNDYELEVIDKTSDAFVPEVPLPAQNISYSHSLDAALTNTSSKMTYSSANKRGLNTKSMPKKPFGSSSNAGKTIFTAPRKGLHAPATSNSVEHKHFFSAKGSPGKPAERTGKAYDVRYKCHYCEKTFSSKSNASQHEMIHTGEKPFSCELCGKSYNRGNLLKRHKLTQHQMLVS